jgi:hypothetical protein
MKVWKTTRWSTLYIAIQPCPPLGLLWLVPKEAAMQQDTWLGDESITEGLYDLSYLITQLLDDSVAWWLTCLMIQLLDDSPAWWFVVLKFQLYLMIFLILNSHHAWWFSCLCHVAQIVRPCVAATWQLAIGCQVHPPSNLLLTPLTDSKWPEIIIVGIKLLDGLFDSSFKAFGVRLTLISYARRYRSKNHITNLFGN